MQIDDKDLLTLVKSFARANPLPLDKDEIKGSIAEAEEYLKSPVAYPGQTIKVLDEDGSYKIYIIQKNNEENGELYLTNLPGYAKLDGAAFTGSVFLAAEPIEDMEAATKAYVDKVAAAGGSDPAEAIQKAKEEAIEAANAYTNTALTWGSF